MQNIIFTKRVPKVLDKNNLRRDKAYNTNFQTVDCRYKAISDLQNIQRKYALHQGPHLFGHPVIPSIEVSINVPERNTIKDTFEIHYPLLPMI